MGPRSQVKIPPQNHASQPRKLDPVSVDPEPPGLSHSRPPKITEEAKTRPAKPATCLARKATRPADWERPGLDGGGPVMA